MSSQYTTEPPPTATVLIHTTAGPLTVSLFASQTPLTCRNFLQLCLDGYYENTIFHRVSPGFVIQTGDPTGTGEGGQNIYEDREFERLDADWAKILRTDEGEPIKFGDEIHSRLKFNRRGLIGMAKGTGENGVYGSQFFITLGDCRAELDGNCTMFGRVEGDGIYNVVKIAEGELIEGTERPMYPEKILSIEVVEIPKQEAWQKIKKRVRVAARTTETKETSAKKKPTKKKAAKALLSFGGDDEGDGESLMPVKPKKAKFNTALIESNNLNGDLSKRKPAALRKTDDTSDNLSSASATQKRKANAEATRSPSPKRRKPSFQDSTMQLPLRNPESPFRSPTPDNLPARATSPKDHARRRRSSASSRKLSFSKYANGGGQEQAKPDLAAEIAALKASMRRDTGTATSTTTNKKESALEALIPATSTRGRKRPKHGDGSMNSTEDQKSLKMLAAFRARLEDASTLSAGGARAGSKPAGTSRSKSKSHSTTKQDTEAEVDEDEEAKLCDLHFISNCQSCFSEPSHDDTTNTSNDKNNNIDNHDDDENDNTFLSHSLTFEKDRLGKDLTWKKKNEEELVVIDPREREKEFGIGIDGGGGRNGGKGRDRNHHGGGSGGGGRRDKDRERERAKRKT